MEFTNEGPTKRVLVADDDPVIRKLITSVAQQRGYIPFVVNDGREVIRVLRTDADFKTAILDMSMPYLAGIDLIRYMQTEKRLKRIPILLVTGENDLRIMAEGLSAGATAFLPKPFTPAQLDMTLQMLVERGGDVRWVA